MCFLTEVESISSMDEKLCEYNVDNTTCEFGFDVKCNDLCRQEFGRFPKSYACLVGKEGAPNDHYCACRYVC